MADISWTAEALNCLEIIHGYIASDSPTSAYKVVSEIHDKVGLLKEHPRLGQRYEPIVDQEIREILYGHYRIAYRVHADDRIEILGVFHSSMDIERYLRDQT